MRENDARKRTTEVQQHNRDQAVRLYQKGMSRQEIAEIVDVHYQTVCDWITRYEAGGESALRIGQRGRRSGDGRLLTAAQEKCLQEIVVGKCPDQLQLPFALWSSAALRALLKDMWGISVSEQVISGYMNLKSSVNPANSIGQPLFSI